MSITVADILGFPCMRGARLVAGEKGGYQIVTSLTVLEYTESTPITDELFTQNYFCGSELVITGFINIRDDIEAQCTNIRRYSAAGEVGMILYYVGIFLPRIDERLIALCNELEFPLICMPENRINLRYSEAICEIMEAIFKDQASARYYAGELLERIALCPPHQRSMKTLLRMLSDRLRASVLLTDHSLRLLNEATWPQTMDANLQELLQALAVCAPGEDTVCIARGEKKQWVCHGTVSDAAGNELRLFLCNERELFRSDILQQACEVVQSFLNIWSRNHGELAFPELVKAILMDEPLKMRRLAAFLRVDVQALRSMWLLIPKAGATWKIGDYNRLLQTGETVLRPYYHLLISDVYEQAAVLFMDRPLGIEEAEEAGNALCVQLEEDGLAALAVRCDRLETTADVRRVYLDVRDTLTAAAVVFPSRSCFCYQDILFIKQCCDALRESGDALRAQMTSLDQLAQREDSRKESLLETLSIYLLDAHSDLSETANRLYLHKNTIKYRIRQVSDLLGYKVGSLPETIGLYSAVAKRRIVDHGYEKFE